MARIAYFLLVVMTSYVFGVADVKRCSRHVYKARAEQRDESGLKCWDDVSVASCGGRCDSRETSNAAAVYKAIAEQGIKSSHLNGFRKDWVFPFKESRHPVCMFGAFRPFEVRLRNCDAGVAPGTEVFRYIYADNCRCKICSSELASCEWLPPNSTILEVLAENPDN